MPIINEEMSCKLKPNLEFTKKLQQFYNGIQKYGSLVFNVDFMQRSSGDKWLIPISRVSMEDFNDIDSFNQKINSVGKRVFGEKNFHCDKKFGKNNEGTGVMTLNYQAYTTCKIKFPVYVSSSEAKERIKIEKYIQRIDFITKDYAPKGLVPDIEIRNVVPQNLPKNKKDTHKIFEDFYWDFCKN